MKQLTILIITAFLLILFSSSSGFGNPNIRQIRKLYTEAKKLECKSGCSHFKHQIILTTMMPAIGEQTTKITFYYTSEQVNPEINPYQLTHHLHKVKVKYNVAASADYNIEYLYNRREQPVFHYWKVASGPDMNTGEKRYYFYKGKLIRVSLDYTQDNGNKVKYTKSKRFSPKNKASARRIIRKAIQYRKLFQSLINAEKLK